jgi:hypothetical protein
MKKSGIFASDTADRTPSNVPIRSRRLRPPRPLMAVAALALTGCCLWSGPARAEPVAAGEDKVRDIGQVVSGIASYVRWPGGGAPLQLCVTGDTRFAATLLVGSAQPRGQQIAVRSLQSATVASSLPACDIVYVGAMPPAQRKKLYQALVDRPILSVSEPLGSCVDDVMFCLKFRDTQVVFEVNLGVLERSKLRVHPNLLQLARRRDAP